MSKTSEEIKIQKYNVSRTFIKIIDTRTLSINKVVFDYFVYMSIRFYFTYYMSTTRIFSYMIDIWRDV